MNGFTNFVNHSNKRGREEEKLGEGDKKGRGKGREEVKQGKMVEFGLQERVNRLKGDQICALLPGDVTASLLDLPPGGLCFLGGTGPWQKGCQGQTQQQDVKLMGMCASIAPAWASDAEERKPRITSHTRASNSVLCTRSNQLSLLVLPTCTCSHVPVLFLKPSRHP